MCARNAALARAACSAAALGLLERTDVHRRADDLHRIAARVADHLALIQDPALPVRAGPIFRPVVRALGDGPVHFGFELRGILRMDQLGEERRFDRGRRSDAKIPVDLRGPVDGLGLDVEFPDAHARGVERQSQSEIALTLAQLIRLTRGDIAGDLGGAD